jgi:predicted nuclease of predicted toxin-antitoxin system
MKFLIDNALSPQIASGLVEAGYDASHVRDLNMGTSSDIDIFDLAIIEQRIIISADTDFGTLLSLRSEKFPSVILFRRGISHIPQTQLSILLLNLPNITELLDRGSIIIFDKNRIRTRTLPISSSEDN